MDEGGKPNQVHDSGLEDESLTAYEIMSQKKASDNNNNVRENAVKDGNTKTNT